MYEPVIRCTEPATRRLSIEDSAVTTQARFSSVSDCCSLQNCMLSLIFVTRAVLVLPDYGAQRYYYQEGQRQRFLQEQYQRLALQDAMAAEPNVPHSADPEATDEALPEGELPEYIQEEDEEEDLLYSVQPQQRSHGDIYLASSVGDTNRVR